MEQLNLDRYYKYINTIIDTRGQWNIPEGEYYENHHIIPKCFGGLPKIINHYSKHDNLIWLYPEEHFICHKIAAEDNPNNYKLVLAFSMMAFPKGDTKREFELSPNEYAEIKILLHQALSGRNSPYYGTKVSEERRKKQSEALKGHNVTLECKQKISQKLLGKKKSEIARQHMSDAHKDKAPANKGKAMSEEQKLKLSKIHIGMKHSEETKKKMSETRKGMPGTRLGKKQSIEEVEKRRQKLIGKHYYNNGVITVRMETCPDGFKPGMLKRKKC